MQPTKLVGTSPAILTLQEEIFYAARCDAKVLITGESGAGKEIVARLIHAGSPRSRSPLVTVNCAALSETLLETELFGHVSGSFTGAYRDRLGAFEQANRGTVFMDEIGETSPRMQGLLLRFLETGEIQRVGSDQVQTRVDVRVIAATNRVLVESVANKTFREDLYYRLNVIHIRVPPLRDRVEDIPVLLRFFLDQFAKQYQVESPALSAEALQTLSDHPWPGNVRELKNVVERLVVRAKNGEIGRDDLPLEVLRSAPAAQAGAVDAGDAPRCRHAVRAHGERRGVVLVVRVCAVHGARSHARRSANDRQEGTGANVRELQGDGRAVQHAGRRLQALPGLSSQVSVPHAVSTVPIGGDEP